MLKEHRVQTARRIQMTDITSAVSRSVSESGVQDGVCVIFVPHTTAGVTINENADPDVVSDINRHLSQLIPENAGFRHSEGNSDAHIKSSLFSASLTVIIREGRLLLGTWQGIYFCEGDGPRDRSFFTKCMAG